MKKDKGYGLLWMLAAEVVLFIFFLAIAPRLNAEGLLYRSAVPVTPEEVLSKDDSGRFELKYGAGFTEQLYRRMGGRCLSLSGNRYL